MECFDGVAILSCADSSASECFVNWGIFLYVGSQGPLQETPQKSIIG